jgi:hypothetical protein
MNVTIVYQALPMSNGFAAAIGLSAVFGGAIVLVCCCVLASGLRKRPEPMPTPLPRVVAVKAERRASAVAERRPSVVEESKKERRPSTTPSRRGSQAAPKQDLTVRTVDA